MNLHEYQAKDLFRAAGISVPNGIMATSVEEAIQAAKTLGGSGWVVKAQIHAGGRGKAGGVKLVRSLEEVETATRAMLHKNLVTYQTDSNGQPVNHVLIETLGDIAKELYLGAVIDRASQRIVIMASTEGGVEIEQVAEHTPEKIVKVAIDPMLGVLPYQARYLGFQIGLNETQVKEFTKIVMALGKMFEDLDLALIEINPLIITKAGNLVCLDGKLNGDENALYRQPGLRALRDLAQEDPREIRAKEWELNYIPLEGNIGCMVNGAGLAMATMDLIKLQGGDPANFLDVGGGATKERVTEAFKIILSDDNVKAILVNIFGGIVRCDLIAEGIIGAVGEAGIRVPVVVRLQGNRAAEAVTMLNNSGLNIIAEPDLTRAAQKVVEAVTVGA